METRRPTASLLAWSLIGLIGGHQAAYLAVYRDPAVIAHVLEDTGHGWMWFAPLLAASAVLTALLIGVRGSGPVRSFRWRFAGLAMIQSLTFLALETSERFGAGGGAEHLLDHLLADSGALVILLGLTFQLLTAFVLAVASRVIDRALAGLGRHRRAPRTSARSVLRAVAPDSLPHRIGLARACPPRAPPVRA